MKNKRSGKVSQKSEFKDQNLGTGSQNSQFKCWSSRKLLRNSNFKYHNLETGSQNSDC